MHKVNVTELKANLSKYIKLARTGVPVLISRRNRPVAEIHGLPRTRKLPRPVGLDRGTFKIGAGFFEPLPDDVLASFDSVESLVE